MASRRLGQGITAVRQMAGKTLALVKGASIGAELNQAVPTMEIVFFDTYALCLDTLREKKVKRLADEVLPWAYAQKSAALRGVVTIYPRVLGRGFLARELLLEIPRIMGEISSV
jgi:ABC-type amino acid transport substrate-binding protein